MSQTVRRGWTYLLDRAKSKGRKHRQEALVRAYSWVERALGACGFRRCKRGPVSPLIYKAYENGHLPKVHSIHEIKACVCIRNLVVHEDQVPELELCAAAISTLNRIWECLRNRVVNPTNAARIASQIATRPGIQNVFLFGSLARQEESPNDIDLLLQDDGTYSCDNIGLSNQYVDTIKRTRQAVLAIGLTESSFQDLALCRWLDIVLIDGKRFGQDPDYTLNLRNIQKDPLFFEHIAANAQDFSIERGNFLERCSGSLGDLRKLVAATSEMGKVDLHLTPLDVMILGQRRVRDADVV